MKFRETALIAIIFVLTIAFSGILQAAPNQANPGKNNSDASLEINQLLGNMRGPNGVAAGYDKAKSPRASYKGRHLRSLVAPADHTFAVKDVVSILDHKNLSDLPEFKDINPSSEYIAKFLYRKLSEQLNSEVVKISKIKVSETPGAGSFYWEE